MSRGPAGECPKKGMLTMDEARRTAQWQKSKYEFMKVNTDAAWCKKTLCAGVGWVSSDFAGLLQAAKGSGTMFCHTVAVAEACVIRDAL
ncbi:hypothetical protein ACFX2A_025739 [Malus domestica]